MHTLDELIADFAADERNPRKWSRGAQGQMIAAMIEHDPSFTADAFDRHADRLVAALLKITASSELVEDSALGAEFREILTKYMIGEFQRRAPDPEPLTRGAYQQREAESLSDALVGITRSQALQ